MKTVLALCCAALPLAAADYFVALDGSDRNPGSINRPFRNIQRGIAAARNPGDTIQIRAGEYRLDRTLFLGNSGTEGRPITLRAYRNEKALIDGSGAGQDKSILEVTGHHIVVEGLELHNSPRIGIEMWGPGNRIHHVTIRNNTIRDCLGAGIFSGFNNRSRTVHDILIEGNRVVHNVLMNEKGKLAKMWAQGISSGNAKRVTVRHNLVARNYGEGIGFYLSEGCVAEGNLVHDNFSVDIYLDNATDCRVIGNRVFSTGDERFFRFNHAANGIMIANETYRYPDPASSKNPSARNVIAHNILSGHHHSFCYGNFQEGGGLIDTLFVNNTLYASGTEQIRIDGDRHRNTLFANNLIHHTNSRKQIAWVREPFAGIAFRNNAWFGGPTARHVRGNGDIMVDPQMIDPAADNFRLRASSPAIGAGSATGLPPDIDAGVEAGLRPRNIGALRFNWGPPQLKR